MASFKRSRSLSPASSINSIRPTRSHSVPASARSLQSESSASARSFVAHSPVVYAGTKRPFIIDEDDTWVHDPLLAFMMEDDEWVHDPLLTFMMEDDQWVFDPSLDRIMAEQVGGGPLLDFSLRPVGPRRNWRNVLDRQRYQASLTQHREPSDREYRGREVTGSLRRSIRQQIANDPTLQPRHRVHFTLQSNEMIRSRWKLHSFVCLTEEAEDKELVPEPWINFYRQRNPL